LYVQNVKALIGIEKDHIRTKELKEQGFKVLRLWECEIKQMCLENFKKQITTFKPFVFIM